MLQEEILKTIETMLQMRADKSLLTRDVASVVTAVNNDTCEVQIDGAAYRVKNGVSVSLIPGDSVWIHIPNGNKNEMFIMAKK